MSSFFNWLLLSSLQASVVACIILATQALLRRKLTARWRYWLWLVLAVRLAMPWAPEGPLSVFNLARLFAHDQQRPAVATPVDLGEHAVPTLPPVTRDAAPTPAVGGMPEPEPATPGVSAEDFDRQTSRAVKIQLDVLPAIWIIGALVLAAVAFARSLALSARISRYRPLTDQKVLDLLEDCKEELGIHTFLAVVETSRAKTPALLGVIRPRLLLPKGMLETASFDDLRFTFLHELAHLKRHDIAVNWLISLLQVLHWFNPLLWYTFYRMRADRELACDALVLSRTAPGESRKYGRTIVSLLESFHRPRRLAGLVGIHEDKSQLKRRITMIAQFKRTSNWRSLPAIVFVAALACVTLTNAQTIWASRSRGICE